MDDSAIACVRSAGEQDGAAVPPRRVTRHSRAGAKTVHDKCPGIKRKFSTMSG